MRRLFIFFIMLAGAVSCVHKHESETPREQRKQSNMSAAFAFYYGEYYTEGLDNYILELTDGQTDDEGNITGTGTMLALDLNTLVSTDMAIADGTYAPLLVSTLSGKSFTFITGADQGEYIAGSYVMEKKSVRSAPVYKIITGGTVDIIYDYGKYEIRAVVIAGGEEMEFIYRGTVSFIDDRETEPEPFEAFLGNLAQGELEYWGQAYGDTGNDYANWFIFLGDKNVDLASFTGEGDLLQIELNTASSYTDRLPEGRYTMMGEFVNDSFKAFTVVPGYSDENDDLYGTWYFNDANEVQTSLSAGWMDVKRNADGSYELTFEFSDQDSESIVRGSYNGMLKYYDRTQPTKSVSSSGRGRRTAAAKSSDRHIVLKSVR